MRMYTQTSWSGTYKTKKNVVHPQHFKEKNGRTKTFVESYRIKDYNMVKIHYKGFPLGLDS